MRVNAAPAPIPTLPDIPPAPVPSPVTAAAAAAVDASVSWLTTAAARPATDSNSNLNLKPPPPPAALPRGLSERDSWAGDACTSDSDINCPFEPAFGFEFEGGTGRAGGW